MRLQIPLALPLALLLLTSVGSAQAPATATTRKVLGVEDYARWRTVDGAQLSADGKWAVYGLRFTNTLPADAKPVLRLRDVAAGSEIEIEDASQASFSPMASGSHTSWRRSRGVRHRAAQTPQRHRLPLPPERARPQPAAPPP